MWLVEMRSWVFNHITTHYFWQCTANRQHCFALYYCWHFYYWCITYWWFSTFSTHQKFPKELVNIHIPGLQLHRCWFSSYESVVMGRSPLIVFLRKIHKIYWWWWFRDHTLSITSLQSNVKHWRLGKESLIRFQLK